MKIHQIKNFPLLVIRKLLTFFFGIFFPSPGKISKKESLIISEVKNLVQKKFVSKSEIGATNYFLDRIRNLLKHGNIRKFIRYDVVLNSLFVQNRLYLIKEYKFVLNKLKKSNIIDEDKVGYPVPFFFNLKTSGNRVHHLYHILRFKDFFGKNLNEISVIFDWGGGYGSMSNLFYKLGFRGTYIIYDFDELHFLQYYYLKTLGLKVNLDNKIKKNHINLINDKKAIEKYIKNKKIENKLFLSCWALSETERNLRDRFTYVFNTCEYILLGFQERYFNINNIKYFKKKIKKNFKKENILIEKNNNNFENHYYIFSKKS